MSIIPHVFSELILFQDKIRSVLQCRITMYHKGPCSSNSGNMIILLFCGLNRSQTNPREVPYVHNNDGKPAEKQSC